MAAALSPPAESNSTSRASASETGSLDGEVLQPRIRAVMDRLDAAIPRGVGTKGVWRLPDRRAPERVLTAGAGFAVEQGDGIAPDLERCEGGVLDGADAVSDRAIERGLGQIGSLASGNHFLEVQAVDCVYDGAAAAQMGLAEGEVCLMIHTGSRRLGHHLQRSCSPDGKCRGPLRH
jgi:tRNA-splicing ligase RtcB